MRLERLHTSWRTRPPAETWRYLERFQARFGVSRVTDITRLDRLGIPVFAAIRPGAAEGSLCVSSGKGVVEEDARIGALCEAIELACAEHDPARDSLRHGTVGELPDACGFDVHDFAVRAEHIKRVPEDGPLELLEVSELTSGDSAWIPASLVLLPFRDRSLGLELYGQSSNGLASGNTREEAVLHALLEVIERDALSFARVQAVERRVEQISEPGWLALRERIDKAGLRVWITTCRSPLRLPMFICYLVEDDHLGGITVARGQGLHFDRSVAMLRAVTEAVQSRLTNIHGGRDDILPRFLEYQRRGREQELREVHRLEDELRNRSALRYDDLDHVAPGASVSAALREIVSRLHAHGFRRVFVYDLNRTGVELAVVKVVVPGLEFFSPTQPRVGKRLLEFGRA